MRSRPDFINELLQHNCKSLEYWDLSSSFDPNSNEELQHIREQNISGNINYQTSEKDNNHRVTMVDLANALHQDIAEGIEREYLVLLENTSLLMMPLGSVDAFCTQRDLERKQLDGSVIIINEGMFYGLLLLFKAVIMESLDKELLNHRSSGRLDFRNSITFFLHQDFSLIKKLYYKVGAPQVESEINGYQSAAATMILQFIALHEFGHIALGHFKQMDKNSEFINMFSSSSSLSIGQHHTLELAADNFALQALMRKSRSEQSMWANFYSIYLFFQWLDCIEQELGSPLSSLHPPPLKRANELRNLMGKLVGNAETYQKYFKNIDQMVSDWLRA